MKRLDRATLEDYLNSVELDGTYTDHAQRLASQVFGVPYGSVKDRRRLKLGQELWHRQQFAMSGEKP